MLLKSAVNYCVQFVCFPYYIRQKKQYKIQGQISKAPIYIVKNNSLSLIINIPGLIRIGDMTPIPHLFMIIFLADVASCSGLMELTTESSLIRALKGTEEELYLEPNKSVLAIG